MSLGDIGSIATLILFVIYFIGRIMTIFIVKKLYYDEIDLITIDTNRDNYNIVSTYTLTENAETSFIITSRQGIFDLKIYKYLYDDEVFEQKGVEHIYTHEFLNINESIELETFVSETISLFKVEYLTSDYKKVSFDIIDYTQAGIITQFVEPKLTLRSFLYYLFR